MGKVVVITSNIAPYRLLWFEELAKHFDVEVYYTQDREKDYDNKFLKHGSNTCKVIKLKNKKDKLNPLCFDVLKVLRNNKNSFILFDGYGSKTNLLGLLYCKCFGIKNYVNCDGYPTYRTKNILRDIVKKFIISFLCYGFFCSGEATKDHLIQYGANKKRICVHNFSSLTADRIANKPATKKEKNTVRKQLGIDYKGNIIIGVGRFVPLKRFEDLINAVRICHTDCQLYLLGGKPTTSYLQAMGDSKNIHFIDFVLPEEVDKYYKMADLFVLPSETDVWGLVINEAIAQGLPVISSDSPVAARSLVDGNGYIFETYNVEQLADCIDKCLDSKTNKQMSLRSLQIAKEFTIEGMVKRQLPIIEEKFKI